MGQVIPFKPKRKRCSIIMADTPEGDFAVFVYPPRSDTDRSFFHRFDTEEEASAFAEQSWDRFGRHQGLLLLNMVGLLYGKGACHG